jgi:hypothetical protein
MASTAISLWIVLLFAASLHALPNVAEFFGGHSGHDSHNHKPSIPPHPDFFPASHPRPVPPTGSGGLHAHPTEKTPSPTPSDSSNSWTEWSGTEVWKRRKVMWWPPRTYNDIVRQTCVLFWPSHSWNRKPASFAVICHLPVQSTTLRISSTNIVSRSQLVAAVQDKWKFSSGDIQGSQIPSVYRRLTREYWLLDPSLWWLSLGKPDGQRHQSLYFSTLHRRRPFIQLCRRERHDGSRWSGTKWPACQWSIPRSNH